MAGMRRDEYYRRYGAVIAILIAVQGVRLSIAGQDKIQTKGDGVL